MPTGIINHLLVTLRLNLRNKMALVYGYVVPIFTLVAFGSYFKTTPPLVHELGQLLTIAVLGGACFGMPTAMVSERERGVWRRYRLLPASTASLVLSTLVARYLIVLSAAVLEVLLAIVIYRMPWPLHPMQLAIAFTFVSFAFLGMGLVIAMLAETVPAVQALGQALFLPVIIIGGVGVPLRILAPWAQKVAGFLPGLYAVRALDACVNRDHSGAHGLGDVGFSLGALTVIGIAGLVAGSRMFRWDAGQKLARSAQFWVSGAVATWLAVGLVAWQTGHLTPVASLPPGIAAAVDRRMEMHPVDTHPSTTTAPVEVASTTAPVTLPTQPAVADANPSAVPSAGDYTRLTADDLDAIGYDDLETDTGDVTPLAANLDDLDDDRKKRLEDIVDKLDDWKPANEKDPVQKVRNLLSLCATADIQQDPLEPYIPRVIFDRLAVEYPKAQLGKILAWIVYHPGGGTIVTTAPELGFEAGVDADEDRARTAMYAKKLLARVLGKVKDPQPETK